MKDEKPHLRRVLGRWDLVLLFVVAVFNLNVVPSIAANGGVTVCLWILSLLLFFLPQGVTVIELAHRFPGEGGVYLWAKEVFGNFHGFLSGWCYWTNNMLYVPTVLFYFVGVSVFVLGSKHESLADNRAFALAASMILLALLVVLNVVGLGVGKWINNLGGLGTGIAAAALIGLGLIVTGIAIRNSYRRYGSLLPAGGIAVLFLTVYGAHLYHRIIGPVPAAAGILLICLGALALREFYQNDLYMFAIL